MLLKHCTFNILIYIFFENQSVSFFFHLSDQIVSNKRVTNVSNCFLFFIFYPVFLFLFLRVPVVLVNKMRKELGIFSIFICFCKRSCADVFLAHNKMEKSRTLRDPSYYSSFTWERMEVERAEG